MAQAVNVWTGVSGWSSNERLEEGESKMATTAPVFEDREMSIGSVIQRAFGTIAHNPLVVLGIAFVLGAVPSALLNFVNRSVIGVPGAVPDSSRVLEAALLGWLIGAVVGAIVQGALTRATVADSEGHRASFGECIAAALRVLLPLIGAGLIFGIAIGLGLVLLIVPGIIIMLIWSVAGPAIVVERDGVGAALRRSSELTSGYRWKIFGLFLVLLAIYVLLFAVLGALGLRSVSATSFQPFGIANLIMSAISTMILQVIWGTIQPALYIELRRAKEGDNMESLEQIFA
jgi:hypothetical protein